MRSSGVPRCSCSRSFRHLTMWASDFFAERFTAFQCDDTKFSDRNCFHIAFIARLEFHSNPPKVADTASDGAGMKHHRKMLYLCVWVSSYMIRLCSKAGGKSAGSCRGQKPAVQSAQCVRPMRTSVENVCRSIKQQLLRFHFIIKK